MMYFMHSEVYKNVNPVFMMIYNKVGYSNWNNNKKYILPEIEFTKHLNRNEYIKSTPSP